MTPTPMTPLQMVIAIVISAVITFSLRALPFVIFHGNRKMPKWLDLPVFYSNRLPFYAFILPLKRAVPSPVPKATDCRTSWAQGFISNV